MAPIPPPTIMAETIIDAQKSNWKYEDFSSQASREVKHAKNQIENPKIQHGEKQPLVESNTPKIELKIRKYNTVENSLSWSQ